MYTVEVQPKTKRTHLFERLTPQNWMEYLPKLRKISENRYSFQCKNPVKYKHIMKGLHLKYYWFPSEYARGDSYRQTFLNSNKCIRNDKGQIRCTYCGRWVSKIAVDHIVPVHKAKQGKDMARLYLKMMNASSVNDIENLCGACTKCNSRKSDKCSIWWIIKARLGESANYWKIRRIIIIILLIAAAIILYRYFASISLA